MAKKKTDDQQADSIESVPAETASAESIESVPGDGGGSDVPGETPVPGAGHGLTMAERIDRLEKKVGI